jgi:hypothetical protein
MTLAILKTLTLLLAGVLNAIMAYEAHQRKEARWRTFALSVVAFGLVAGGTSKLYALI